MPGDSIIIVFMYLAFEFLMKAKLKFFSTAEIFIIVGYLKTQRYSAEFDFSRNYTVTICVLYDYTYAVVC